MIVELLSLTKHHIIYSIEHYGHVDRSSELKKKEVVYRVLCQDCDGAYIGETGRSLQKRLTEHKYAVRTNDRKNDIAVHAWDMDFQPDWEAAEVVEYEPHYWKRRVLEAIWIQN